MKNLFIAAIVLTSSWATAQNFEGVITMNTTNEAMMETATLTWYLKGENSRMDIDSKAGDHATQYTVIADTKGMDMIADGQVTAVPQTAMSVDMKTQQLVSETKNVSVNGYNCTQAVFTDGTNQTTYWLAEGIGLGFNDLPFIIKRNMPKISSSGFPLKMEKRDASGKIILSQDVVSITPSTVSNSKFERN